jgi:hypothetical protein
MTAAKSSAARFAIGLYTKYTAAAIEIAMKARSVRAIVIAVRPSSERG